MSLFVEIVGLAMVIFSDGASRSMIGGDSAWKGLHRAGGICFLLSGILSLVAFVSFFAGAPFFTSGEQALRIIPSQKLLFQTSNGIFTVAGIFLIPGVLALYVALREVNRTYMAIALGLSGVALVLNLGLNAVSYSLVRLSKGYAAATTEAQRAGYVAAAELVIGISDAGFLIVGLMFSVSTLIVSLVMMKGIFNKSTSYLGILAGIFGIIGSIPVPALFILGFLSALLFALWFLAVGYKLYKLG